MKRILILAIAIISGTIATLAGGILTNTNQTVHFLRNPARGASLEIDGVYTNPAGLIFLNEGFHFTLNNQSAFQERKITSTFAPFAGNGDDATKEFVGNASAWLIPSFMAVYRIENWAISGSISVVGGGGTAVFDKGLPSFEALIAAPVAQLSNAVGIPPNYSLNSKLEGSSIIFGAQIGVTYKINDNFSAFAGGRMSIVNNGYLGYLKEINLPEANYMTNYFPAAAASARGIASNMEQLAAAFGGSTTLGNVPLIKPEDIAQMAAGLGMTPEQISGLTLEQAQNAFNGAAAQADGAAQIIEAGVNQLTNTKIELDTEQSGIGFAPILGLNINFGDFNFGIKYEFITKLEVENKTKVNTTGIISFEDKEKTYHDIPALLTVGASYKIIAPLTFSCGYHHFFEKDARMGYDGKRQDNLDGGTNEILAGLEYRINPMFLVSCGFQMTRSGATDAYQQDLSYSLKSNSYGIGGTINFTENLKVNLGYFLTAYTDWTKDNIVDYYGTGLDGKEVFSRTSQAFGIGIDFSF
ncbi:MAG: hypothetical protein FWH18_06915 [Marinilabiliaceae bacterium]|nr:hypothetical protein [Marinilabiliaceae bacterium]